MNWWHRILVALALGVGFGLLPGAQAALAAPASVCTVNEPRLPEITGLVATTDGYAAVTNPDDSIQQVRIFLLDRNCAVTGTVTSDIDPRDTEDLARTTDGTYWVGDIGDASLSRATIAVHVFPASGTKTIQRMRYPDGAKNSQALLVEKSNVPVIITKSSTGTAKVYYASAPLTGGSRSAADAVPLKLAGDVSLGSGEAVTGAAQSPDGKRIALRTATSIFEWDVTGGDMATSLVKGKPRQTKLTGLAGSGGGAVAYTADSKSFLTVPDGSSANPAVALQRWPDAAATASAAKPSAAATKAASSSGSGGSFLSKISFDQITLLVAVVGAIGLALLVSGIVGIVRFRRRAGGAAPVSPGPRAAPVGPRSGAGGPPGAPPQESTMQLPRVPGSVYGRPPAQSSGQSGSVYGSRAEPPAGPRGPGPEAAGRGGSGPGGRVSGSIGVRPENGYRSEGAPGAPPRPGGTVYGGRPADPESGRNGSSRPSAGRVYGGERSSREPDPRSFEPSRDFDARDIESRGGAPVERAQPTRIRRAGPPPTPPGSSGGSSGYEPRERQRPAGSSGPSDDRNGGSRDGRPPTPPGRRPPSPPDRDRY